jgi:hypothetical protein
MAAPAADSVTVVSAEGERFSVPRRVRPRAARRRRRARARARARAGARLRARAAFRGLLRARALTLRPPLPPPPQVAEMSVLVKGMLEEQEAPEE